jgi:hypothetical protein
MHPLYFPRCKRVTIQQTCISIVFSKFDCVWGRGEQSKYETLNRWGSILLFFKPGRWEKTVIKINPAVLTYRI